MAHITSLVITQPYYYYFEENDYNVIPAVITLNFDSLPSQNPADYTAVADFGSVFIQTFNCFSTYSNNNMPTITFTNNSVALTMNQTYDSNCTIQIYYQTVAIPYILTAQQDPTFDTPAIWKYNYFPS